VQERDAPSRLSFHQRTIRIIELMEEAMHRQRAWPALQRERTGELG
jgi:hypothetical protein